MTTFQTLTPREAYAKYIMGSVLVDVREKHEEEKKKIGVSKIVSLPMSQLAGRADELPHDRTLVLLSGAGIRSKEAARYLAQHGFDNVANMDGGVISWEEEGLPLQ